MMKRVGGLVRRGLLHRRLINPNQEISAACISQRFIASSSLYRHEKSSDFVSLKSSPLSSLNSAKWSYFRGQRRTISIKTQCTLNPSSLMFYPGKPVMGVGTADFPNARSATISPLAEALYAIDGITRVFFGSDFITVTKFEDFSWDLLKPKVFAAITDFFSSGKPLFQGSTSSGTSSNNDLGIPDDIRIRPSVKDDGSGCPSSCIIESDDIEDLLMQNVPEVKAVEQELDSEVELTSQTDAVGQEATVTSQTYTGGQEVTVTSEVYTGGGYSGGDGGGYSGGDGW